MSTLGSERMSVCGSCWLSGSVPNAERITVCMMPMNSLRSDAIVTGSSDAGATLPLNALGPGGDGGGSGGGSLPRARSSSLGVTEVDASVPVSGEVSGCCIAPSG